jgi:hypothetical protein
MSSPAIFGSGPRDPARSIPRRRTRTDGDERPDDGQKPRDEWIGVDFARWAAPSSSHGWMVLVALALVVALGVAALRIDLIRTRYALAEAMAQEASLLAEQRELIARQRQLRDPTVLARLAQERGFRPALAARVLPEPGSPTPSHVRVGTALAPPRSQDPESLAVEVAHP